MTTIDLDSIYDTTQAAAYLGLSTGAVSQYAKRGQIDYLRRLGTAYLFTKDHLDAFNATRPSPVGKRRTAALEHIIRELYGCPTNPEPISAYLTKHQALAEQVIAGTTDDDEDQDDDVDRGQPEDEEVACPVCQNVYWSWALDEHVRNEHPLRPVAGY